MTFGEKLCQIRHNKHLTQKDLGKLIGKTGATICDWEKSKSYPSLDELVMLADIFQVTTDYLLGRINAYSPIGRLIHNWEESKDHTLCITLVKKFTPENMELFEQLICYLQQNHNQNDLLVRLFRSAGYRIDTFPETIHEWEEPEYELSEQRDLRLEMEWNSELRKGRR